MLVGVIALLAGVACLAVFATIWSTVVGVLGILAMWNFPVDVRKPHWQQVWLALYVGPLFASTLLIRWLARSISGPIAGRLAIIVSAALLLALLAALIVSEWPN